MTVCGNCGYTGDDSTYTCPVCGAQMYYQEDDQYYNQQYDYNQSGYDQSGYDQGGYDQGNYDYSQQQQYDNGGYYDNYNGYDQNTYQQAAPAQVPDKPKPKEEKKKISFSKSLGFGPKEEKKVDPKNDLIGVTNDGRQFFIPDAKKKVKRTSNTTTAIVTIVFAFIIAIVVFLTSNTEEEAVVSSLDVEKMVTAMTNTLNLKSADFTINYNYTRINGNFEIGNNTADTMFYAGNGRDEDTLRSGNYYTSSGGFEYSITENYDNDIGFPLIKDGGLNKDGLIQYLNYDDMASYEAFSKKLSKFANDVMNDSTYMAKFVKSYEIVERTQTLVTYRAKIDLKELCVEINKITGTKLDGGKYKGSSTVTITIDNDVITAFVIKANKGNTYSKLAVRLYNVNAAKVDVARCDKIKTEAEEYIDKYGSIFADKKHTSIFDCFTSDDDDDNTGDNDNTGDDGTSSGFGEEDPTSSGIVDIPGEDTSGFIDDGTASDIPVESQPFDDMESGYPDTDDPLYDPFGESSEVFSTDDGSSDDTSDVQYNDGLL